MLDRREELRPAPDEQRPTPPVPWAVRPPAGAALGPAALLGLQRSAGNRAVSAMLARQAPTAQATAEAPDAALIAEFEALWEDDPWTVVRLGLELLRPFPVLGMLPAIGSDVIGMVQDVSSVPRGDPLLLGIVGTTVVVRSLVNLASDGVGQVLAVTEPIEWFLGAETVAQTFSGWGIPFDVISVPLGALMVGLNEGLGADHLSLITLTSLLDFVVTLEAAAGAVLGPVEDSAAWSELMAGYIANMAGDVFAIFNEALGLVTLSIWPSGSVGQLGAATIALAKLAMKGLGLSKEWSAGFWNVLGGKAIEGIELPDLTPDDPGLEPTGSGPEASPLDTFGAAPLARLADPAAAGGRSAGWFAARLLELDAMRGCYERGDGVLAGADQQLAELVQGTARMAEEVLAGTESADAIKDTLTVAVGELQARLSLVADVGAQAASASEQLSGHSASVAGAIETLETARCPSSCCRPRPPTGSPGAPSSSGWTRSRPRSRPTCGRPGTVARTAGDPDRPGRDGRSGRGCGHAPQRTAHRRDPATLRDARADRQSQRGAWTPARPVARGRRRRRGRGFAPRPRELVAAARPTDRRGRREEPKRACELRYSSASTRRGPYDGGATRKATPKPVMVPTISAPTHIVGVHPMPLSSASTR